MNQSEAFGKALWVCGEENSKDKFFVLRGKFTLRGARSARLRVLGLGFFHCYINGARVSEDLFLPLHSDYEPRENYPSGEKLSHHRIYATEFDVAPLVKEGENVIAIHFGGGWYTQKWWEAIPFGNAKAIWRIFGEDEGGRYEFTSSVQDKILPSFVKNYNFTTTETQDYSVCDERVFETDFDDSAYPCARLAKPVDSDYRFGDCPLDRVCERLKAVKISETEESITYDCGKNTSGYPVLRLKGKAGDKVRVLFSEERTLDGGLDRKYHHDQMAEFVCDGRERIVRPLFTWFAFRYFAVCGNAEVEEVEVVHTAVERAGDFRSDNELLNWIHETFVNTCLTNMHAGIPSDCPHIERRGYTGDGQLVCRAAMHILDGEKFYRKWVEDILDCQDDLTGHVQYTAPYVFAGGGPGGWGCAIVEVPYQHYRHYKDTALLEKCYPQMLKYFEYLEAHSEGGLVVSDKEGCWCLGDWCAPADIVIPAPFVNNYFYIKSLNRCIEIAKILKKEEDIEEFKRRIEIRKKALISAYYNAWDGNFFGGLQGANAFAVDIGLGDARTYENLKARYGKLGGYDTGIFGTDILTRVLFERGDSELAMRLLTSGSLHSYAEKRRLGATTLWETWPGALLNERSHNHPMFGAVTAYFYDHLLGISNENEGGRVEIKPVLVDGINELGGWRRLKEGTVSVSYQKNGENVSFAVEIPAGQTADFVFKSERYPLSAGKNEFSFPL